RLRRRRLQSRRAEDRDRSALGVEPHRRRSQSPDRRVTRPILQIAGVIKDYRGLRPLRVQALSVTEGESVALVGLDQPSAEMLVNLVTGATLPDAGDIVAFGRSTREIADGTEWLAMVDRVGIVSERAVLLEALTVLQNLAMPFTLDIDPLPEGERRRAEDL